MIDKLKSILLVFASDKWAGTIARHAATILAGVLISFGLSPEIVTPFQNALVPILTAGILIIVGLFGSRKAKG